MEDKPEYLVGSKLAKWGKIDQFNVMATLHLSGARISNPDRDAIAKHILADWQS